MKEDLLKIIEHYGVLPQLKYFQSEVYELTEAIINFENLWLKGMLKKEILKENIVEEIADVMVMLNQFIEYYNLDRTEIELIMNKKIKRQLGRIENE